MTVATQVKQTLASLKGTHATLSTFAAVQQDAHSKELLENNLQRIERIIHNLEHRIQELEFQEPQYKGF